MQNLINKPSNLIFIHGLLNGGKTTVFQLFEKEDNFICLDIYDNHYNFYKEKMIKQIGGENVKRLETFIKSKELLTDLDILIREICLLVEQFPGYNFVIKPPNFHIANQYNMKDPEFIKKIEKYISISKIENIYHLFVCRHLKLSWVTCCMSYFGIERFIKDNSGSITEYVKLCKRVKIEEIKHNKFLKKIIKKTDLNTVLPYTRFDLEMKIKNNYDNIYLEFKKIEEELDHILKTLKYDKEDKYVQLFMDDDLDKYTGGI